MTLCAKRAAPTHPPQKENQPQTEGGKPSAAGEATSPDELDLEKGLIHFYLNLLWSCLLLLRQCESQNTVMEIRDDLFLFNKCW